MGIGKFGMELVKGAGSAILGQGLGMIFGRGQDKRQLKQQEKLNELQIKGNKEMSEFERQQQMKMWRDTNYQAQVEEAKKAGMSISALYGGSGAGGSTTGGGSGAPVSGGQAGDPNAGVGMGLQMASQLALMKAQKENIEADTENKKAESKGKEISNVINKETTWDQINIVRDKAIEQTAKAVQEKNKGVISEETMQDQIKQVQEETINKILNNGKTKKEIRIKEAEATIQEFEASLSKQGISTKAPWYLKMVADLLKKVGLNPL